MLHSYIQKVFNLLWKDNEVFIDNNNHVEPLYDTSALLAKLASVFLTDESGVFEIGHYSRKSLVLLFFRRAMKINCQSLKNVKGIQIYLQDVGY